MPKLELDGCCFSASSGLLCLVCRPCRGRLYRAIYHTKPRATTPFRWRCGVPDVGADAERRRAAKLRVPRPLSGHLPRRCPSSAALEGDHATALTAVEAFGVAAHKDLVAGLVGAAPLAQGAVALMDPRTRRGERGVRGAVGGWVVDREHRRTPRLGTDAAAFIHGHAVGRGPLYSTVVRRCMTPRPCGSPVSSGRFRFKMSFPGGEGALTTVPSATDVSRRSPLRRRPDAG